MKVGVGHSTLDNPERASREAAENAIRSSGEPALTFLFTTDSYDQEIVFETVKGIMGNSRMVGFCGGGIITSEGVFPQAIAVATLSGTELRVMTSLQRELDKDPQGAGCRAGEEVLASGINRGAVIVLPDGFAANIAEVIRGLYDSMGPDFTYIGGGAGDNLRFFKTYQFTEMGLASNALAVSLVNGAAIGMSIGHGWKPTGNLLVVTKAKGKRVFQFDAKPAFDVYSERLGNFPRDKFAEWGMRYPLGIPDIHGNYLIRDPLFANDDKSIDLVTEIPVNAVADIMKGNIADLIETARFVAKVAAQKVAKPEFALVFDCISRYLLMGKGFNREIRAIREAIGKELPMLGVLTFGEVGSYAGVPQFHNKTVAIAVLGSEINT